MFSVCMPSLFFIDNQCEMKILYILRHNPWGIGGGCYASRNYLEAFCEILKGNEMEVLVCAEYLAHGKMRELPNVHFIGVNERKLVSKLLSPVTGEKKRFICIHHKLEEAWMYSMDFLQLLWQKVSGKISMSIKMLR